METTNETKKYEIMVVTNDEEAKGVRMICEKNGFVVQEMKPPTKIALAYAIKKQAYAFVHMLKCSVPAGKGELIADCMKELNHTANVLRYLIERKTEKKLRTQPETAIEQIPKQLERSAIKIPERKTETELSNKALEKKIEEMLQ